MALPDYLHAAASGSWRAFWPPIPPLEPEDGDSSPARATTSTSSISPQSVPMLQRRAPGGERYCRRGGRVLFVGTKRQAQEAVADAAKRSAQYYVNSRWLGGMLTNWKTISDSIRAPAQARRNARSGGAQGLTKKERLMLPARERDKLDARSAASRTWADARPDFRRSTRTRNNWRSRRRSASNIPVAARSIDTNCDPDGITFPVPGQ
jgi:small subunit ribosomal protein S2